MSFFLLTFEKTGGVQPAIRRFEDPAAAMEEFAAQEALLRGSDHGVVLLVADDEETLRTTHSHYFADVGELLAPLR